MLRDPCEQHLKLSKGLPQKLAKCGIKTLGDLLFHVPSRYLDRTQITPIAALSEGMYAVVQGYILKVEVNVRGRRKLTCYLQDDSGVLCFSFFNVYHHQIEALKQATSVRLCGDVSLYAGHFHMVHPEYQCLDAFAKEEALSHRLTPVYPSTEGLTQNRLRQLIQTALTLCRDALKAMEWMQADALKRQGFLDFLSAVETLHYPLKTEDVLSTAISRLAFDELLAEQISMRFAASHRLQCKAPVFPKDKALTQQFIKALPFALTNAQQRVFDEIMADLSTNTPMLRVVQGDVGCGKTAIAALAALQIISRGYQVALMTPTDILSEQHTFTFERWFTPLGFSVHRLSAQMGAKNKKQVLDALKQGKAQLIIGTHALFQDAVAFHHLGLVIVDEQHRFGVAQRLQLQQKAEGETVHQLFMTATPIPRTLAMMQSAHLDISIVDERPALRKPVQTVVIPEEKYAQVIERLATAMNVQKQIYWVCPFIDASEVLACAAATERFAALRQALPHARIGLMHGRLKAAEKEAVMRDFKQGLLDILVATLVIEVGVDVPNASIIVIESAQRLGLAQLHQLRGRVGRGAEASYCLLLYQSPLTPVAKERLLTMRETDDGFLIAEKDLVLRGTGDVLGIQQTGCQLFKCADLHRDKALLPHVLFYAKQLMTENLETAQSIATRWRGVSAELLQG